jgi:hypothetical protein
MRRHAWRLALALAAALALYTLAARMAPEAAPSAPERRAPGPALGRLDPGTLAGPAAPLAPWNADGCELLAERPDPLTGGKWREWACPLETLAPGAMRGV